MLDRALRAADWLSLRAVWGGGALLFLAAFTVSVDVIARKLFTLSLGGADELSGYAFAIGTAWAFPFALLRRANVRVDALYQRLPAKICAVLDIVALLALGLFVVFLTWYAWDVAQTSWSLAARSNSALKVPMWIPQAAWVAGLALYLITLALLLARALKALLNADWETIRLLLGARSVREEANEEASYAHQIGREGARE